MTRRPSPGITTALALVALVAVGCSSSKKSNDAEDSNSASRPVVQPTPLASMTTKPATKDVGVVWTPDPTTPNAYDLAKPKDLAEDEPAGTQTGRQSTSGVASYSDAESLFGDKRYEEAAELFTAYTEQHPDNPWGHYMRGLSSWKAGDPSQAEAAFALALTIDPYHVKSLVNLSRVLIEEHRADEALDRLMVAREADPASSTVHRMLGRVYHAQDEVDDAMEAYRHAITLDDSDAWSMNNLGLLLLEQGYAEEAVPSLARAVELRQDLPAFHNNLGMALEHTGRFSAATDAYDTALVVAPGHDRAWTNFTRVEKVTQDATVEPFNLETAADQFVEDMKNWKDQANADQ